MLLRFRVKTIFSKSLRIIIFYRMSWGNNQGGQGGFNPNQGGWNPNQGPNQGFNNPNQGNQGNSIINI